MNLVVKCILYYNIIIIIMSVFNNKCFCYNIIKLFLLHFSLLLFTTNCTTTLIIIHHKIIIITTTTYDTDNHSNNNNKILNFIAKFLLFL